MAGGAEGGSGAGSTTGSGGYNPPLPTEQVKCDGKLYQCGDLADNDMDGWVDSQDPDCTGPCDNTEDSLYPNLPGMTGDPCSLDCFWDNGNGSGNDHCYWDHRCDPLEVAPDYPPEGEDCAYDPSHDPKPGLTCEEAFDQQPLDQSPTCYEYCAPLVPNGCDCFGCCELPARSGKFVWLGSTDLSTGDGSCTLDAVEDTSKCKPCTFVEGCGNPCEPCEYCLGKTELPEYCFPDGEGGGSGNPDQCPEGEQPCGPGDSPCPSGYYCITGCCIEAPT